MRKFWASNEELTPEEQRLVLALYEAHATCVFRENCSTMALQQAAGGSRSLTQSYIAALATLGEMHGPIEGAYDLIQEPVSCESAISSIRHVWRAPGWGNSFIKGRIDDAFVKVDQTIEALFPRHHNRLREITDALHARGKHVFPNPAAYTATTALILGMPRHLAPLLFVESRLQPWAAVFHLVISNSMKPKAEEEAA